MFGGEETIQNVHCEFTKNKPTRGNVTVTRGKNFLISLKFSMKRH